MVVVAVRATLVFLVEVTLLRPVPFRDWGNLGTIADLLRVCRKGEALGWGEIEEGGEEAKGKVEPDEDEDDEDDDEADEDDAEVDEDDDEDDGGKDGGAEDSDCSEKGELSISRNTSLHDREASEAFTKFVPLIGTTTIGRSRGGFVGAIRNLG